MCRLGRRGLRSRECSEEPAIDLRSFRFFFTHTVHTQGPNLGLEIFPLELQRRKRVGLRRPSTSTRSTWWRRPTCSRRSRTRAFAASCTAARTRSRSPSTTCRRRTRSSSAAARAYGRVLKSLSLLAKRNDTVSTTRFYANTQQHFAVARRLLRGREEAAGRGADDLSHEDWQRRSWLQRLKLHKTVAHVDGELLANRFSQTKLRDAVL